MDSRFMLKVNNGLGISLVLEIVEKIERVPSALLSLSCCKESIIILRNSCICKSKLIASKADRLLAETLIDRKSLERTMQ